MSGSNWLSDAELERLLLNTIHARGRSEKEIYKIVSWAEGVKIDEALLANVLSGDMEISFSGAKPKFKNTKKGDARAESLKKSIAGKAQAQT